MQILYKRENKELFQHLGILACLTVQAKAETHKKETNYNFSGVLTSK